MLTFPSSLRTAGGVGPPATGASVVSAMIKVMEAISEPGLFSPEFAVEAELTSVKW